MAASSALVPILVAVIGVVGALVPALYVNSLQTQPESDVTVTGLGYPVGATSDFVITIDNILGNAPATNLTLILDSYADTSRFVYVKNLFSTTNVVLSQYHNIVLEPGSNRTINQSSPLKIHIPKLIHGIGSSIRLMTEITNSTGFLDVYALYDQGSNRLHIPETFSVETTANPPLNLTKETEKFTQGVQYYVSSLFSPGIIQYYIVFFTTFGIIIYLYMRRRKTMRRFLSKVVKNIVEIRGALRNDLTNKDIFSEVWFEMPEKKRQDNHNIGDYLIIDDFYSQLRKRNSYLSSDNSEKEGNLSNANTLSILNEALLAAAENALNRVDWNKYR